MTNRKDLKRTINYICSELFAECIAASLYGGKQDKQNTEALLTSILRINNDFVKRISHPEPGMPKKKYFQKALSKDCIDYIKGNPLRLLWCYRQLQPFHYSTATLLKWYLKSIRI